MASFIFPVVFILLGVYLIMYADDKTNSFLKIGISVTAVLAVLLFWGSTKALIKYYSDKTMGLQWNETQLIYKPNTYQHAIINWSDVTELKGFVA